MLIVLTFCVIGFLCLIYSHWERNQLKTEQYLIFSKKIKKKFRFVFLTDLHEKEFGEDNAVLLKKIRSLKPNCILIGGDFPISHSSEETDIRDEVEKGIALLQKLKEEYKVYYAFGNHEEKLFTKKEIKGRKTAFQKALEGVTLIDGKGVFLDEEIYLAGFPLDISYYRPLYFKEKKPLEEEIREKWKSAIADSKGKAVQESSDFEAKIKQGIYISEEENRRDSSKKVKEEKNTGVFRIAMLHSPFYREEALSLGVDLLLSGHFHGGAVGIPFIALMTPQFRFFVGKPRGLFKRGEKYFFISRGLGTHTINVRIHNFPELSCFDLCPVKE